MNIKFIININWNFKRVNKFKLSTTKLTTELWEARKSVDNIKCACVKKLNTDITNFTEKVRDKKKKKKNTLTQIKSYIEYVKKYQIFQHSKELGTQLLLIHELYIAGKRGLRKYSLLFVWEVRGKLKFKYAYKKKNSLIEW